MKSTSFEAFQINERLKTIYGIHEEVNKARFRIVHSDDQYEKRFGTFQVYSGNIWLREETGIRETEKYPWLSNQWVVERLQPNETEDVYEGDLVYEPLWAFDEKLPLNMEMVEFVVKKSLNLLPQHVMDKLVSAPRTRREAEYRHKEKLAKESAMILNRLDNTALQSALHDGGAVQVPNKVFIGVRETVIEGEG